MQRKPDSPVHVILTPEQVEKFDMARELASRELGIKMSRPQFLMYLLKRFSSPQRP